MEICKQVGSGSRKISINALLEYFKIYVFDDKLELVMDLKALTSGMIVQSIRITKSLKKYKAKYTENSIIETREYHRWVVKEKIQTKVA